MLGAYIRNIDHDPIRTRASSGLPEQPLQPATRELASQPPPHSSADPPFLTASTSPSSRASQ